MFVEILKAPCFSMTSDGRWTDADCAEKRRFICKLESETDPKSHGNLGSCDPGMIRFENSCISVSRDESRNFEDAKQYCAQTLSNLVKIETAKVVNGLSELDFFLLKSVGLTSHII